jgi:hypothetical protein
VSQNNSVHTAPCIRHYPTNQPTNLLVYFLLAFPPIRTYTHFSSLSLVLLNFHDLTILIILILGEE